MSLLLDALAKSRNGPMCAKRSILTERWAQTGGRRERARRACRSDSRAAHSPRLRCCGKSRAVGVRSHPHDRAVSPRRSRRQCVASKPPRAPLRQRTVDTHPSCCRRDGPCTRAHARGRGLRGLHACACARYPPGRATSRPVSPPRTRDAPSRVAHLGASMRTRRP